MQSFSLETLQAARNGHDIEGSMAIPGSSFNRTLSTRRDGRLDDPEILMFRVFSESSGLRGGAFRGAPLQFSFRAGNGEPAVLHMGQGDMPSGAYTDIQSRYNNNADAANAPVRAFINTFRGHLDAISGGMPIPENQQRSLFMTLGQNGNFVLRKLESAIGRPFDPDHSAYAMDVRREDNGDFTVRHSISDVGADGGRAERAHFSLTIHPDGSVDSRANVWVRGEPGPAGN
jgi:hypothetical protein